MQKKDDGLYISSPNFFVSDQILERITTEKAHVVINLAYIDKTLSSRDYISCQLTRADIMDKITYAHLELEHEKFKTNLKKIIIDLGC